MSQRRRVSYVIPPPENTSSIARLQFPPRGAASSRLLGTTAPLLLTSPSAQRTHRLADGSSRKQHPRHRLGIGALALDSTTQLYGKPSPQGILYSGGRDGLVLSWDLGLATRARTKSKSSDSANRSHRKWESVTGWDDDDQTDEDEVSEMPVSDGDVLGDVTSPALLRRRRQNTVGNGATPEISWELDRERMGATPPAAFRQGVQLHNDWINDMVLCNQNQTVVTASSDGSVKSWSPNVKDSVNTVGRHPDYVRCLAYCREQNWVASGSFDRTIKLWDLTRSSASASSQKSEPLVTLTPPDLASPKSSVYAIAADPFGHAIASGSPERVVRMWDPRSGKRTAKFVGHTDNIRDILISDDARYLLTGSADASIKLWSLSSQRCLHTFTHHTDSVWSLFSSHPSLEVFYSADRTGLACKVDIREADDVSDGECILLCREDSGIQKVIANEDNSLVWTAAGGKASIKRWSVPLLGFDESEHRDRTASPEPPVPSPSSRLGNGHPISPPILSSFVKLVSPNEPYHHAQYTLAHGGRDEVATLYSAASVMSVPRRADSGGAINYFEKSEIAATAKPLHTVPDDEIVGANGLIRCVMLNDKMHVLAVDTAGQVGVWDVVRALCRGVYVKEEVDKLWREEHGDSQDEGEQHSARDVLEIVRSRIEGEAVVSSWATADTKSGVLTIHVSDRCFDAEVFADEVGFIHDHKNINDETKLNVGKWVLRNLFIGFIREEQRTRRQGHSSSGYDTPRSRTSTDSVSSMVGSSTMSISGVIAAPTMIPAIVTQPPPSLGPSPLLTPMIPLYGLSNTDAIPTPRVEDATPMPNKEADYFSTLRPIPTTIPENGPPMTPEETPLSASAKSETSPLAMSSSPLSIGLMGRLKSFGKQTKKIDTATSPVTPIAEALSSSPSSDNLDNVVLTPQQTLLTTMALSPPPSTEVPLHLLPSQMPVVITNEDTSEVVYRGTVGATASDVHLLEEAMPMWLMEYLLLNKIAPPQQLAKVSFILLPWKGPGAEGDALPELLNTAQSKLTASRMLRVRKVVQHVHDKIQAKLGATAPSSRRPSVDNQEPADLASRRTSSDTRAGGPKPEDLYEILCNEMVLPLDMTLIAVRQYAWRSSSELSLCYRRKI